MTPDDDLAISIQNVSKTFRLPHEKQSSLKGALINTLHGGNHSYEKQTVLNNISLDIKKGEFFGIVGRNGSGKSTLLKMLAGIYAPTHGHIQVNGKLTPFIELGVGFNPELTGRENVYLNGALLGFNRKEMNAMYQGIVDFAEIERFMDQKLKNYSSGMQVRLAFSIAIQAQTDILLLDEVLAVGDQNFQDKCFAYFDQVKKTDTTVIFISHDSGAIEKFCTRAAIIDRGKLVDIGDPRKMVLRYGTLMANEKYGADSITHKKRNREGNGIITIDKTELLDSKRKSTHTLAFGESFTLRAHYTNHDKLPHQTVVGIDLIDISDISVLGPNTGEVYDKPITISEDGYFEAAFSINVLSPGEYHVTVGIFNDRSTFAYDLMEKALSFKIVGAPKHGKIYVEPVWSFDESVNGQKTDDYAS